MQETIVKQFLLERAYQQGIKPNDMTDSEYQEFLYREYDVGNLDISNIEIASWISRKENASKRLGAFLKNFHFIQQGETVTEITTDASLSCFQEDEMDRRIILSKAGIGYSDKIERQMIRGKLIINGAYLNQQGYIEAALQQNVPFVIGFVKTSNINYNEFLLQYYRNLKEAISTLYADRKVSAVDGKSAYVLTHKTNHTFYRQARFPKYSEFVSQR